MELIYVINVPNKKASAEGIVLSLISLSMDVFCIVL